jgi:hypothetical protein
MPYRKNAEENAPSTKYLIAASCDEMRRRCIAVRTYTAIDRISSPRKITMRSLAIAITTPPVAESSTNT